MRISYGSKNNQKTIQFSISELVSEFFRPIVGGAILLAYFGFFVYLIGSGIYENCQPPVYNYITVLEKKTAENNVVWIKVRNSDGSETSYPEAASTDNNPFTKTKFQVGGKYRIAEPTNHNNSDYFVGVVFGMIFVGFFAIPCGLGIAGDLD
jgi:hypothetical protein